MADRNYITVSELNYYINRIIQAEDLLHNVPVVGEVSNCSIKKNNCYFTLKDANSQISIVYFNVNSRFVPTNGEKVLVRGMVDYYQSGGQINIKAYEITRFGIGEMHAKLEALKAELAEEGIFDDSHKKQIPTHPINIAIITSTQGAALQDFLTTLAKYDSKQNITVIDVRVQGEYCVSDVLTALRCADSKGYDVIILARGGGSFEDLYSFNDESIVRTIYNMKTPVITGIGHETDYTLCDFVSDYRAITPTASAEKIVVDFSDLKAKIYELSDKLSKEINNKYNQDLEKLSDIISDLSVIANETLNEKYRRIIHLTEIAKIRINEVYSRNSRRINELTSLLDAFNPLKLIEKGYFRILSNNKIIYDFDEIKEKSELEIIGKTEKITAMVTKKEKL